MLAFARRRKPKRPIIHWGYTNQSVCVMTHCATVNDEETRGYKEFHRYLSCPDQQTDNSFKDATDHMKVSTRQYAKRQISWIRNKLLPAVYTANTEETVTPTYLLDATGKAIQSTFIHRSTASVQSSENTGRQELKIQRFKFRTVSFINWRGYTSD